MYNGKGKRMARHNADHNGLYGVSADELLKRYEEGLLKAGMEYNDVMLKILEIKQQSNNYNQLFERLIPLL